MSIKRYLYCIQRFFDICYNQYRKLGDEMFEIKQTKIENLPIVLRIVNMSKEEFALAGIDQWQKGYPKRSDFLQDIMVNESYTIFDDDCIMGTFMLSKDPEPTYNNVINGAWLHDGDYAVIHRFTIDPTHRRQGLASKTFKEIELILGKDDSIKSIRIDSHKNNLGMQSLLKKMGYEYIGLIYLKDGDERYAYEKFI